MAFKFSDFRWAVHRASARADGCKTFPPTNDVINCRVLSARRQQSDNQHRWKPISFDRFTSARKSFHYIFLNSLHFFSFSWKPFVISLEADAAGTASAVMQLFTRTNKFRKQTNIKRIFFVTSAALRREFFAIFREEIRRRRKSDWCSIKDWRWGCWSNGFYEQVPWSRLIGVFLRTLPASMALELSSTKNRFDSLPRGALLTHSIQRKAWLTRF